MQDTMSIDAVGEEMKKQVHEILQYLMSLMYVNLNEILQTFDIAFFIMI